MTLLFGICLAVGGVTALLSVILGGHADADAGADVDAPADADVAADAHIGPVDHADVHAEVPGEFWILFASTRFWVFFLTFFGLSGLLFQLAGASDLTAALVSLVLGAGLGLTSAWVFRMLVSRPVSSDVRPDDLVGLEVKVMLPVSAAEPGKVRIELRGMILDRIALTEDRETIARGDRAMILGVREDRVLVSRSAMPMLEGGSDAREKKP